MHTEGESEWFSVRLDIRLEKNAYCDISCVHPDDMEEHLANSTAELIHRWLRESGHWNLGVAGEVSNTDWKISSNGKIMTWVEREKVWMTVGSTSDYE